MKFKFAVFMVFLLIILPFTGCSNTVTSEPEYSVAILMHCSPNDSKHIDADAMQQILNDSGYNAEIYYANKDVDMQNQQILDLIGTPVDAMIITPVDDDSLTKSLELASREGIVIIAYDKLILNTDSVNYLAAYDHSLIGIQQGMSLIEGLRASGEGPYNIELFSGTSKEENVKIYFNSALSVLQPLIDSGEIVVVSNEISYSEIHDEAYKSASPDQRLHNLLDQYYSDEIQLHGILAANDKMAIKFIDILENNSDKYSSFPVITGQNADIENIQAIVNSRQHSTVFKNPHTLAEIAASMAIAVLNGETPDVNDSTTFDNGVKIVPAYLSEPILVTKDNYQSILLDTGYYEYMEVFPEH